MHVPEADSVTLASTAWLPTADAPDRLAHQVHRRLLLIGLRYRVGVPATPSAGRAAGEKVQVSWTLCFFAWFVNRMGNSFFFGWGSEWERGSELGPVSPCEWIFRSLPPDLSRD